MFTVKNFGFTPLFIVLTGFLLEYGKTLVWWKINPFCIEIRFKFGKDNKKFLTLFCYKGGFGFCIRALLSAADFSTLR